MNQDAPRTLEPRDAGQRIAGKLANPTQPMTVADVSVACGLPLRDAEAGLLWLTSEYRGHLRVTEDGDLLRVFPNGFTKPWETRDAIDRVLGRVGAALLGAGRLVVRAWILVAIIAYAAIFVGVLLALTFARSGNDRDRSPGLGLLDVVVRVLGDALFWTLHPWSPLYIEGPSATPMRGWRDRREQSDDGPPFYEKVNRFVFGPAQPPPDPAAVRARILAEIRAQEGRIGLSDVMRVTGMPRDQADPLMARLMLDHDGEVLVSDEGGISYRFQALRRSALDVSSGRRPRAAWETPAALAPLTGNDSGANVMIVLLNAFNLLAGTWFWAQGLTLTNVMAMFHKPRPLVLPDHGTAVALGLVPMLFSLALFALPMIRAALRGLRQGAVDRENARLAVLREVLARTPRKQPVTDAALRRAYREASGIEPSSAEITRRVVELGGDVDVGPEGQVRYRFAELEAEAEALEAERAQASDAEARIGKIVFASDA